MKKIQALVVSAFLSLTCTLLHAQSFDGGLVAGAVVSQINGDGYSGFHQLGCTAGFFGRIPSDGPSSWQIELKYTLLGAHSDAKEVEIGMSPMSVRLHYVELPVLFRYDLSRLHINGKSLNFITLEVGLSGDFLIRGTQSADFEEQFDNASWRFFSLTGDLGVQFDFNAHWGVNIRGMASITPCRRRLEAPVWSWQHYYNVALQAALIYTFVHSR